MPYFKKKQLISLACVVCVLILITTLLPAIKSAFGDLLRYPLGFLNALRREASGIIFYHRNYLQREKLERENNYLRQKSVLAAELKLENNRLKNLLSVKNNSPYKVLAAQVIGRSPENWSSSLIVDKGRHHGIAQGMVVLNFLGLIGRVADSAEGTAKVMLINDPNFAVSAVIQRSRQEGLVCGTLGNSLVMRYLPRDADVRISDTVITSGLTSKYPKGILIGIVTDVGEEFSGLSSYAVIKPAVRLSNIEEVLIIVR